jgi:hypothetical protein
MLGFRLLQRALYEKKYIYLILFLLSVFLLKYTVHFLAKGSSKIGLKKHFS